jgi:hypothetical protein
MLVLRCKGLEESSIRKILGYPNLLAIAKTTTHSIWKAASKTHVNLERAAAGAGFDGGEVSQLSRNRMAAVREAMKDDASHWP